MRFGGHRQAVGVTLEESRVEELRERFNAASNEPFTEAVTAATGALVKAAKPVIAMIKGYCIGGGMVIASACDVRICAEGSRFGVPAGRLGLGYELDNYKRLFATPRRTRPSTRRFASSSPQLPAMRP